HRQRDADREAEGEAGERFEQRDPGMGEQRSRMGDHRGPDVARRRQDVARNAGEVDGEFPGNENGRERDQHGEPVERPDGQGGEGTRAAHALSRSLSTPIFSNRRRMWRVWRANSGSSRMAKCRSCGSSTGTISSIRPGRGDITTTRLDRKTASLIEWVMNRTVLPSPPHTPSKSKPLPSPLLASPAPTR